MEALKEGLPARFGQRQPLAKTDREQARAKPDECRAGKMDSPGRPCLNCFLALPIDHDTHEYPSADALPGVIE